MDNTYSICNPVNKQKRSGLQIRKIIGRTFFDTGFQIRRDAWRKTIASRIPDVEIKEIRKLVYSMVGTEIAKKGARVDCRYYLI